MPQLMPLNWILSSIMILVIIMSVSMLYSKETSLSNVEDKMMKASNKMDLWFW